MHVAAGVRMLGVAALVVVVPTAGLAAGSTTPAAAANPVISSVAPDPSVARGADGAFHEIGRAHV